MKRRSLIGKAISTSLILLLAAALMPLGGCGGKDEAPKHRTIKGKVTAIDPATGQVKMLWYNPKTKQDQPVEGTLAPDAEILINGRTALLEDVMMDDNVTVTGRVEKTDGQRKLVAIKVDIRRQMDDAGTPDTGTPDTGTPDTETPDTEPAEAEPGDAEPA